MESDPRIGTVLDGRYHILEQIASGGMGAVYRAERVKLGRTVAIKFLHAWSAAHAQARKRFDLEAQAMARLDHPNCASVIDFGVVDSVPYVVMEYAAGETLRDILDLGPVDLDRAVEIMRQILLGLAHAHDQGIIHRDIKPANIVVGSSPRLGMRVKILDFGLARLQDMTSRVTAEGKVLGTPAYMAPEQTRGGEVDARSDLYACGVLLFEMLTGRKPFEGDDAIEVLHKQRQEDPPLMSTVVPYDFGPLEQVVARALNKYAAYRFQSAAEFAGALTSARQAMLLGPSAPDGTARVPRALARGRAIALTVLGCAMLGIVLALAAGSSSDSIEVASRDLGDAGADADAGAGADAGVEARGLEAVPDIPAVHEARDALAGGNKSRAIELLQSAEKQHPDAGYIPYLLGRLYFDKLWWKNGLAAYRDAIRIDPDYRTHEPLIQSVLRGFIVSLEERPDLADFLYEDIGEPAIPFLEKTAGYHPKAKVRNRAAQLLQRFQKRQDD